MSEPLFPSPWIPIFLALLIWVGIVFLYRYYSRLSWTFSVIFALVLGFVVVMVLPRLFNAPTPMGSPELGFFLRAVTLAIGFALAGRVLHGWIGQPLSREEKAPDSLGFRTWLSPLNVLLAIAFAAGVWRFFEQPFFSVLLVTLGLLAARPLFASLASAEGRLAEDGDVDSTPTPIDLNADRDRVLRMLEEDKITPDEGAELLKALGDDSSSSPALPPRRQRFLLCGAFLVLVGFLLPWISVNPGRELSSVMDSISSPLLSGMQDVEIQTSTVHANGGDIENGLGWIILFAGLGTAVIWLFAPSIEQSTKRTLSLLALGVGSLILLYLLASVFRHLSIGFPVVVAGYVLLGLGVFRGMNSGKSVAEERVPASPPAT